MGTLIATNALYLMAIILGVIILTHLHRETVGLYVAYCFSILLLSNIAMIAILCSGR